jgi:cell division protein FtsQ
VRRQARPCDQQTRGSARLRVAGLMLALVAVIGAVGLGVQHLLEPSALPVRTLRLGGELTHTRGEHVSAIAQAHAAGGFLALDVDAMRSEINALPWVREVAVRRIWPDVVAVELREHHALARWGEAALVSEEGHVFAPADSDWPQGLPVLAGPQDSAPGVAQRHRELRQILAPLGLGVAALRMSERRALELHLDNGLVVLLGRDDPQARLERFVRVYPTALAGRADGIAQVDLRYTNGFAVAWKKPNPTA